MKLLEEDPLKGLDGRRVGRHIVRLVNVESSRLPEARRFSLALEDSKGRVSGSVVEGRYFAGRGKWIKPWVEIDYRTSASFAGEEKELTDELIAGIFEVLSGLVPPGGHIMVKYGEHEKTARALALNVPPPATPIGYLLWRAGFRWFKDWYFPEGWMEGDTKLQGNKPLDGEHERKRAREAAEELRAFLGGDFDWDDELLERCRELARKVLSSIGEHAAI